MSLFLVLKPEYPHEGASNSLFTVKKGEVLECPPGYEPSDSFQVCESHEAAQQYIKLAYRTDKASAGVSTSSPDEITTSVKERDKSPSPAYPLFRRVSSPDGSEQQYRLFARDVQRFLAREEIDVLSDIQSIKINEKTAQQLLDCELKQSAPRKEIVDFLKDIFRSATEEGKEEEEVEKEEVKESSKGITSPDTFKGKLSP